MHAEQKARYMLQRAKPFAGRAFQLLVVDPGEVLHEQPCDGRAAIRLLQLRVKFPAKARHGVVDSGSVLTFI